MPKLAYYVIASVILAIVASVLFFALDPLTGIFIMLVANYVLKLEERNE